MRLLVVVLPFSIVLSGCFFQAKSGESYENHYKRSLKTLADLEPAVLPDHSKVIVPESKKSVAKSYEEALLLADDPDVQRKIRQRLAGLSMADNESALLESDQETGTYLFTDSITAYQELLKRYPNKSGNDELYYQLAKAYELKGDPDTAMKQLGLLVAKFPQSQYVAEANFRRGEWHFSNKRYQLAQKSYRATLTETESPYYQSALYMQGWSQFKLSKYQPAIDSFYALLDKSSPSEKRQSAELNSDSIRVLAVIYSYMDGAKSISESRNRLGAKDYEPRIYNELASLYLSRTRYRDSADTYQAFVQAYPNSPKAVDYSISAIEALKSGNFFEDVRSEKKTFYQRYKPSGEYFAKASPETQQDIRDKLSIFLDELASYHHALAQTEFKKKGKLSTGSRELYVQASYWYEQFIAVFPDDPRTAEKVFLLAESYDEVGNYPQAIAAYERAAYQYEKYPKGAEAGYAAILAYKKHRPSVIAAQQHDWQGMRIDSAWRFVNAYQQDKRAAGVLVDIAQTHFKQTEYQEAIAATTHVEKWQSVFPASLTKTLLLVAGHSQFELGDYVTAESSYKSLLPLLVDDVNTGNQITDKLAAAIYKQGEVALQAGEKSKAIAHYLRIAEVAPRSEIRPNAEYDAASLLLEDKQWVKAIPLLEDFRRNYVGNPLAKDIPFKLAIAYQETQQWSQAAAELSLIESLATDKKTRAESLYLAAELYRKAGDDGRAIDRYRRYAHNYPQPFDTSIEARSHLANIYAKQKNDSKHRYWLKKIIDTDAKAGAKRTDRSRYLAASASKVFADDAYFSFKKIKLTLPIKKSLKRKKTALNSALKAYSKTIDYGVQDFATAANFRIGEIYAQLSRDLMDSQRPGNLDELEMEQYEILLEEQAYPFEEKAIALHEGNVKRAYQGIYDDGVKDSFAALTNLLPVRYKKYERTVDLVDDLY